MWTFLKLRGCLVIARNFSTSLQVRRSPSWEALVCRILMRSVDGQGKEKSPLRDSSNMLRRPCLPAWSKAPGCPFSLLRSGVQSRHCHRPSVWPMCVISSHTHTHTHHPSLRTPHSQSTRHSAPLLHHPLYIHDKSIPAARAHTHTHVHTQSTLEHSV